MHKNAFESVVCEMAAILSRPQCVKKSIIWKGTVWADVMKHDDVIKWKHFLRYWTSVRGIHRSPVNSPHKGQWRGALMFSLICVWISGWVKKTWGWWFETLSWSFWRHCNGKRHLNRQYASLIHWRFGKCEICTYECMSKRKCQTWNTTTIF